MQQNTNEITLKTHGDVTVLDIIGDITAFSESSLSDAYGSSTEAGAKRLLLKIDNEAYINSGGIAVLIQVLALTKRNGQTIGITGVSEHFKKIFNMVGITKFANIFDSVDHALEQMGG
jgi:anti-anti-sigma factor